MKHTTILISILAIVACGGGKKPKPAEPKEPEPEPAASAAAEDDDKAAPEPEPAAEPAPPPPPKSWHAQAELAPVKGAKLKGTTVTFAQQDGQPVAVASTGWFAGIKAGKYHLLVHSGTDCGANATKAGKPMAGGDIPFTATKGADSLDVPPATALQLDGDSAIVGHPLVLHDDRKGKPGKALACGVIAAGD